MRACCCKGSCCLAVSTQHTFLYVSHSSAPLLRLLCSHVYLVTPCSAPLPGKSISLKFKGPLMMADNSKSFREVQVPALSFPEDPTDPDKGQAVMRTSGLYAAGPTRLRLRRSATFTNNTKGALWLSSSNSSAHFAGPVTLDRNSDAYKAGMTFINSSVSFVGPLRCSFAKPWPDANTSDSAVVHYIVYGIQAHGGCIAATGSTVVFSKPVKFLSRPGTGNFSSDHGLTCSRSNILFKGTASFAGGAGNMWKLEKCNVVAEQAVVFKNSQSTDTVIYIDMDNASIPLTEPALVASAGNLVFKAGLVVSGNSAGGIVLKDKQRLTTQGPSMTCVNNTGTGMRFIGLHGACLYAGGQSVVIWQTTSGCVQGNSCMDDTVCISTACRPPGFPRVNATCGAIWLEEDSTLDFGSSRVAFGGNVRRTPSGELVEADVIVFEQWYDQSSAAGFTCSGGLRRGLGEYSIQGEVCAPGCTGNVCTCPQGTLWSAAACQCT
jgi:hypothetical protein